MSHEPMSSGATSSEAISPPERDETIPQAHTGFSADAELVIAAITRMEAAMRSDRAAFERLHGELEAMANAIAQAKARLQGDAIDPDAAADGKGIVFATLLDELQLRVDTMRELAGARFVPTREPPAAPAVEPPTEPLAVEADGEHDANASATVAAAPAPAAQDRVPTVSGVVSRLGRTSELSMPTADHVEAAPPPAGAAGVPTVSMLEAMVEALTSSAPAATQDTNSGAETETDADCDPAAFLFESEPKPEPEPDRNPADFLREPEPSPTATSNAPPQPEATPVEEQNQPQSEVPAPTPADPLAPIKAMSPEEKIALFS